MILIYLGSCIPVFLLVEFALKRISSEPDELATVLLQSLTRGLAYSPVLIGAGHGQSILAGLASVPWLIGDSTVKAWHGIPLVLMTVLFLSISATRWRIKKRKGPNQAPEATPGLGPS